MSLFSGVTDTLSDVTNVMDAIDDVVPLNPVTASLSMGVTLLTSGAKLFDSTSIFDELKKQQDLCRSPRDQRGEKGKEGAGDAGGSVFERIALAMGDAMDKKLNQMLQAADNVANLSDQLADKAEQSGGTLNDADKFKGEGGIMRASAQVTARGQELNAISQAANSAINSLGQAVSTAARKQ